MEELKKQLLDAAVNAPTMEEKQAATMNLLTIMEQERKDRETDAKIASDKDHNEIQKEANSLQRLGIWTGLGLSVGGFLGGLLYDMKGGFMSQPFSKSVTSFGSDFIKKLFHR